jgi:hypothetical protein
MGCHNCGCGSYADGGVGPSISVPKACAEAGITQRVVYGMADDTITASSRFSIPCILTESYPRDCAGVDIL